MIGGAEYLAIQNGKVLLRDPAAFARDAETAKRTALIDREASREANPKLAKRGKARATSALIKLSSAIDKRLALAGIISDDGVVHTGKEAETVLSELWTPTFSSASEHP
jgi:hypothetical protein